MSDRDHPFLRPLWRRIVLVAVCLLWAAFEYVGGSPTWTMIAVAFAAYGAWQYLYLYKPPEAASPSTGAEGDPVIPTEAEGDPAELTGAEGDLKD